MKFYLKKDKYSAFGDCSRAVGSTPHIILMMMVQGGYIRNIILSNHPILKILQFVTMKVFQPEIIEHFATLVNEVLQTSGAFFILSIFVHMIDLIDYSFTEDRN
jgi:hypothetical protein